MVPATKNNIKVVLDQEKVGNPCSRKTFESSKANSITLFPAYGSVKTLRPPLSAHFLRQ